MAICKSCGAEIIWVKTVNGKSMPVNIKKTVIMCESFDMPAPKEKIWLPISGHESHFSSCPNAAEHRKPKAEK